MDVWKQCAVVVEQHVAGCCCCCQPLFEVFFTLRFSYNVLPASQCDVHGYKVCRVLLLLLLLLSKICIVLACIQRCA
jgi:hypothetical protein